MAVGSDTDSHPGFHRQRGGADGWEAGSPPETTQEILKQLGCLGTSRDRYPSPGSGDKEDALHSVFREAVHAGLVYRENGAYMFLHDRVQEAAYALIPKDVRARLHLRIGRSLIAKMNQDEIEDKILPEHR